MAFRRELTDLHFLKARTTNQTSASFVSKVATATEPTGTGSSAANASVLLMNTGSIAKPPLLQICPFGVGSNNNTFSLRAIGWRQTGPDGATDALWLPVLLAEILCTLSSSCPGVSGKIVADTEYFADTVAVTYGNANVSVEVVSPANDISCGHVMVGVKGFPKVELSFSTGGSATSCNALYCVV